MRARNPVPRRQLESPWWLLRNGWEAQRVTTPHHRCRAETPRARGRGSEPLLGRERARKLDARRLRRCLGRRVLLTTRREIVDLVEVRCHVEEHARVRAPPDVGAADDATRLA